MIEIHLDGKPVTKLEAARSVAKPGGDPVVIGEPNAEGWLEDYITVYPRRRGTDEVRPAAVHWASYTSRSAADSRTFASMIVLGADVAELAGMIAAESDKATTGMCPSLARYSGRRCELDPHDNGTHKAGQIVWGPGITECPACSTDYNDGCRCPVGDEAGA